MFGDFLSTTATDPDHYAGECRYVTVRLSNSGRLLMAAHAERGERKQSRRPWKGRTVRPFQGRDNFFVLRNRRFHPATAGPLTDLPFGERTPARAERSSAFQPVARSLILQRLRGFSWLRRSRRRGLERGFNELRDVELVGGLVSGQHQQALAILAELLERDRAGERVLAPKLH